MSLKLPAGFALLLAALALMPTGCRSSGKSALPPDHVLAQYAPRGVQPGAEYTVMQTRDLASAAPAVAAGTAGNWSGSRGSRGGGASDCTSGCCSH